MQRYEAVTALDVMRDTKRLNVKVRVGESHRGARICDVFRFYYKCNEKLKNF